MSESHSDALVFFGATGDLAYKKIFPALQAMVKRGHLNVPVIGVAKAGWNLDQLKARARDSVEKHGGLDPAAFDKLCGLLRYVDGDYNDPATFHAIRKELGAAQRPAHYLAIPPALFGLVVEQLAKSGCTRGARVIVEKPFGRDLASARELNRILLGTFDETAIFRIDHYLGKRPVQNLRLLPLRQLVPGAVLEPQPCRERADHHGGGLRRPGPGRFLRRDRHHPRRGPESPAPGSCQPGHGAAGPNRQRIDPRREGQGPEGDPAAGCEGRGPRAVPRLPERERRGAGLAGRDLRRAAAGGQLLALARSAVLHPGREMPAGHLHGGRCPPAPAAGVFTTCCSGPNYLRFRISPDVTIALGVTVMDPDERMIGQPSELLASHQPGAGEMDAYERVLGDAMAGDATLFAREDYVEEAWRIVDPVLKAGTPSTNTSRNLGAE